MVTKGGSRQLTLVNVRKHTALSDGHVAEKFIQLLIIANGELEMTRDDTRLLVVTRCVPSQLENLSS